MDSLSVAIARALLTLSAFYVGAGIFFAALFHAVGLKRMDPATAGAGIFFRALVTPGIVALWPLVALRWRGALRARAVLGSPHRPVSAGGLRGFHRRLVWVALLTVPLAAALAVHLAPRALQSVEPADSWTGEPGPLPRLLGARAVSSLRHPVELRLLGDAEGRRQIEMKIDGDLEVPSLVAYWSPNPGSPASAVFLGGVWGPGTRRYELPQEAETTPGTLLLWSFGTGASVGSFDVPLDAPLGTGD